ncbi:MAG: hypothetical protein U9N36_09740 [Euryarchaeota archaeon]|nr:hypothetical protein [Euryarchaeota archaeon]
MAVCDREQGREDSYIYESDVPTFYHQLGWRNVVADYLIFRRSDENESVLVV